MKKISLLLLALLLLMACEFKVNLNTNHSQKVSKIIDSIQAQMIPDKRDFVFEFDTQDKKDTVVIAGATNYPEIIKKINSILDKEKILFQNKIQLLPFAKYANKMGITRLSVANLRAKPKHSAELVTQTLMGMPLQILREKNGFYQVKTPESYYAWIDGAGLKIMDKNDFNKWQSKEKVIVTYNYGQAFSEPKSNAQPVSDIVMNNVFVKLEENGDYIKVAYPDGRIAYIKMEKLLPLTEWKAANERYATPNDVIQLAKNYIGIPYLWGGSSTKGIDCSGFSKSVYAQLGYLLPRDASQQVKIGKKIEITNDFKNLQPGDLLFFGSIKNAKEKITHVAIHIDKGRIIHATGEVKFESLNAKDADYNPDRRKSLLQVRRIFREYPQKFAEIYSQKK